MPPGRADANHEDFAVLVRELDVRRGEKRVLPGISLSVRRGVVTGLLGPSGSGKTTLMRALVGVQVVHGGEVTVLGRPAGVPELRRSVAYVTQAPSIYADLTVAENLVYFARVLEVQVGRIEPAIAGVGLQDQRRQVVGTLSGGERSRASLAVALLAEPELLVLDEPTVGLDPVLRRSLWELFDRLAAAGTTLLISSHVMDEAVRCQRLLLMREGLLVADDSPDALIARTGAADVEGAFLFLATGAPA